MACSWRPGAARMGQRAGAVEKVASQGGGPSHAFRPWMDCDADMGMGPHEHHGHRCATAGGNDAVAAAPRTARERAPQPPWDRRLRGWERSKWRDSPRGGTCSECLASMPRLPKTGHRERGSPDEELDRHRVPRSAVLHRSSSVGGDGRDQMGDAHPNCRRRGNVRRISIWPPLSSVSHPAIHHVLDHSLRWGWTRVPLLRRRG